MILVTNDDGIFAPGMWALARELTAIDRVVIVTPDRERSAIGTAMTLRHPLRVRQAHSVISGVDAYAVDGTPGDSVILAVSKLCEGQIDMVVSGINEGLNTGDDLLISGTVGAALQGYLRNLPAVAISSLGTDKASVETTARLGALIADRIKRGELPGSVFLNINTPRGAVSEIHGIAMTRPAHKSHVDRAEEGSDGRHRYYWLKRREVATDAPEGTDISAVDRGLVSITPLHTVFFGHPPPNMDEAFCQSLFARLREQPTTH